MSATQAIQRTQNVEHINELALKHVPINVLEEMVDNIKDTTIVQQTQGKKMTQNVSDKMPNQVAKNVTESVFSHLVTLDEKTIADSTIEWLIIQVIILLEHDLQDFMGLSEDTLKQLQILYRESMKKSES